MLLNGEHNFAHNLPTTAAAASGPSAACDADPFPASSSDSNPKSQIQNPQSEAPDYPSPGRRQVPLTFNPIIHDEVNILAALARGDRTIPDLAEEQATTVTALCLWLQREDIQEKLNALSSCGATLTRIAAVNNLPKAVSALSFQIDGYIFDRTHNLIKPGLDADRVAATRDANVRKAAHLLLRLAKFDPNQPVYRRRERADRAIPSTLSPRIADRTDLGEARSPAGGADGGADGGAVERSETEGALLLISTSRKGVGGEEASAQHEPVKGALNTPPQSAATTLLPTSHIPLLTSHFPFPTPHFIPRDDLLAHGPAP